MRENRNIRTVNNPRVGSVHASDFERIGPDFIRAEDVSGDVGHHQRHFQHVDPFPPDAMNAPVPRPGSVGGHRTG